MKKLTIILLLLCPIGLLAQKQFKRLTVADGLLNNQICQLVELPNGQIIVGTEGMFNLYNGYEFIPQECNLDSLYSLPAFGYHSYLWQGDSILWLKDFYRLYLYDARIRSFRYDYRHRITDKQIQHFINERGDSLTKTIIMRLDDKRPLLDSLTNGTSLQGQWLTAYLHDRQGGQWFGMQNAGILYLPPKQPATIFSETFPNENIRCLQPLDDIFCLIGTTAGIYIYDTHKQSTVKTLIKGDMGCTDMSKDKQGRIWISSKMGLFCYNAGEMKCYNTANVKGMVHHHIRFAEPLNDGRLLVCNLLHHLGYFYPEEHRFELLNDKLTQLQQYRTMIAASPTSSENEIVVCTQNGIFLLDISCDNVSEYIPMSHMSQYSQKHNCILRDSHKRLWIGTENGLLLANGEKTIRLTKEDGLSNTCIRSIVEDNDGNLWVGTSYGINRIKVGSQGDIHILALREAEGVPAHELVERGAIIMPDGKAYFASMGGIVSFQTEEFETCSSLLPVVLVGLEICGESMSADTLPLRLTYRENDITIQFSSLNYATTGQTRYRYRLTGIDENWFYDHTGKGIVSVTYHSLMPGAYIFEAQSAIGDGNWGPIVSKVFTIIPPWWQSWWAKSLYILLSFSCVILLIHFYLKRRKVKLERDNEEKVNRLFEIRSEARHRFAHSVNIEPGKITANKEEEDLVQHLLNAIEQNMDNTDYTVDQLAKDIGMSRANLYKKMQTMLGITPNEFLRNVRLKHAAHLLTRSEYSVSQVSLMVGFLTPRYFSQCFKKMFGVLPSEYGGRTSG